MRGDLVSTTSGTYTTQPAVMKEFYYIVTEVRAIPPWNDARGAHRLAAEAKRCGNERGVLVTRLGLERTTYQGVSIETDLQQKLQNVL